MRFDCRAGRPSGRIKRIMFQAFGGVWRLPRRWGMGYAAMTLACCAGLACWIGIACCVGCEKIREDSSNSNDVVSAQDQWFIDITEEVGLDFVYENGATGQWQMPEIMGSGVAFLDYDHDGDLDIYLTNGSPIWSESKKNQPRPVNRLFRQESDGRFVDVTDSSGLGDPGYGMGVAVGDMDNDGYVDVYVTNLGPDRLYRNRGDGTFEDVTSAAGIHVDGWSASAVFFDYDRDGFLDLYVSRYLVYDPKKRCVDGVGRPDYCGPKDFPKLPDVLLRNMGDGRFRDVSDEAGIASIQAPGLGVVCEDLNDDGWIDVYVANDMEANLLWINQGDGTFRDDAVLMGAAYNLDGQAESGMGVIAFDLDNDTRPDLFVTHLDEQTNTAYRNLGGGLGFSDVTGLWGLAQSGVPWTGFSVAAFDVELDGDPDLMMVNGRVFRGTGPPPGGADLPAPWDRFAQPNLFYVSDGTGRFRPLGAPVASLCESLAISRALAIGDLDADGDMDMVISNIQGPARLYRNDAPRQGHWLVVRAMDPRLRRDALGARVTISFAGRELSRTIMSGFGYLSSSEPIAHFGLGSADRVDRIEVRWPDGAREVFPGTPADRRVELLRGGGRGGT